MAGRARFRTRRAFLQAVAAGRTDGAAARKAGVTLRTVHAWRLADPEFRASCEAARSAGDEAIIARLEAEADKRATRGYREPVYTGGKLVGHRRKYSDALLMFRLKALRPQRYGMARTEEPVVVELRDLDAEEGVDET